MQKNNADIPPETEAWFCHNATSKADQKKLPGPALGGGSGLGHAAAAEKGSRDGEAWGRPALSRYQQVCLGLVTSGYFLK